MMNCKNQKETIYMRHHDFCFTLVRERFHKFCFPYCVKAFSDFVTELVMGDLSLIETFDLHSLKKQKL